MNRMFSWGIALSYAPGTHPRPRLPLRSEKKGESQRRTRRRETGNRARSKNQVHTFAEGEKRTLLCPDMTMDVAALQELLVVIHRARCHQSRLSYFLLQLSPSSQTSKSGVVVQKPNPQLHLVLDSVESLIIAAPVPTAATIGSLGDGLLGDAADPSDEWQRLKDTVTHLQSKYTKGGSTAIITLNDLPSDETVPLLSLIFSCARSADERLAGFIRHRQADVATRLNGLKLKRDDAVQEELASTNSRDATECKWLTCPFQTFAQPGPRNLLLHIVKSKPWLVLVELSSCLLGDRFFVHELLPELAQLQQLQLLLLMNNTLSDVAGNAIVDALTPIGPSTAPHETLLTKFPALRLLNSDNNPDMSTAGKAKIEELLAQRRGHFAEDSAEKNNRRRLLLIHCEAPAMHGSILARALQQFSVDRDVADGVSRAHILSGTSFSAVVAVALAFGCSRADIWAFFDSIARSVFEEFQYAYYAVAATRKLRQWWTGGDYYDMKALREAITRLLGADNASLALGFIPQKTGKHVALLCSNHVGDPLVFRSWPVRQETFVLRDATGTVNGSLSVTVLDALAAACATPHMFAPARLTTGTSSPATLLQDASAGRVDLLVADVIAAFRSTVTVTRSRDAESDPTSAPGITARVWLPAEPTIAEDVGDPLLQRAVASRLKSVAEKLAVDSRSHSRWIEYYQTTTLWSDINAQVSCAGVSRMCVGASAAVALEVNPALQRQAGQRRLAVRLDECHLDGVAAMDEFLQPPW